MLRYPHTSARRALHRACAPIVLALFALTVFAVAPSSAYAQESTSFTCTCTDARCSVSGQPGNWSVRSVERGFRLTDLSRTTMRLNGSGVYFYRTPKDGNGRYRQVYGSKWQCTEVASSAGTSRPSIETQATPRSGTSTRSPRPSSSPRSPQTNTSPQSSRPTISPAEECRRNVQGRVSRDYEGNKNWDTASLQRLCRGTTRPAEPGKCFQKVMFGGVDWGGGTRWAGSNALDLCEGTSDANGTVVCFRSQLSRIGSWQPAIRACDVR